MAKAGIYKIENTENKKVYIGQSKNLSRRLSNHKYELSRNNNQNKHLQNSWNKYGEECFTFEIICECSVEELNEKEDYYISTYDSFNNGFNNCLGGANQEILLKNGLKLSEYVHTLKKNNKGTCIECGAETENGYARYCLEHKYFCKKCGIRKKENGLCDKCGFGHCVICNTEIQKSANNQKYCEKCRETIKKEQARIRKRRFREKLNVC